MPRRRPSATTHFLEGEEDSESDSEEERKMMMRMKMMKMMRRRTMMRCLYPASGKPWLTLRWSRGASPPSPLMTVMQSHILHLEHDLVHVTKKNHARQAGS